MRYRVGASNLSSYKFSPPPSRSANMRRIAGTNTRPELLVRNALRQLGHTGYRLHRSDIPGRPDVAFVGKKIAIFVNGCFWHRHSCNAGQRVPKTNVNYWVAKISRNVTRDRETRTALRTSGWRVLVVWECETRVSDELLKRLSFLLNGASESSSVI